MSIKLVLLKSGEQVIADAKELVAEEKVRGYLLNKPQKVSATRAMLLTEEEGSEDGNFQITLSPYILLTKDEDVVVSTDWVVTVVDPIESLTEMYQEKVNGQVD
mgnify:FL=1|jgi:hypothetical protein